MKTEFLYLALLVIGSECQHIEHRLHIFSVVLPGDSRHCQELLPRKTAVDESIDTNERNAKRHHEGTSDRVKAEMQLMDEVGRISDVHAI